MALFSGVFPNKLTKKNSAREDNFLVPGEPRRQGRRCRTSPSPNQRSLCTMPVGVGSILAQSNRPVPPILLILREGGVFTTTIFSMFVLLSVYLPHTEPHLVSLRVLVVRDKELSGRFYRGVMATQLPSVGPGTCTLANMIQVILWRLGSRDPGPPPPPLFRLLRK